MEILSNLSLFDQAVILFFVSVSSVVLADGCKDLDSFFAMVCVVPVFTAVVLFNIRSASMTYGGSYLMPIAVVYWLRETGLSWERRMLLGILSCVLVTGLFVLAGTSEPNNP